MNFEADRRDDVAGEPSLAEMTQAAIERLATAEHGYFLIVEGALIDYAHHQTNAYRALVDTVAFADAVQVAIETTNAADTLILVTADHSHTFSISGYPDRGNPILGYVRNDGALARDMLGRPYTTLSYANGPGAQDGGGDDPLAPHYLQAATRPLISGTHGGEDVAAYARGPNADRVRGVMDQNELHGVLRGALTGLDGPVDADAMDAPADDAIVPSAAAEHGN